ARSDPGRSGAATCEAERGVPRSKSDLRRSSGGRRWAQVDLRRTGAPPDRCFLPDLTRFGGFRRTGPELILGRRDGHSIARAPGTRPRRARRGGGRRTRDPPRDPRRATSFREQREWARDPGARRSCREARTRPATASRPRRASPPASRLLGAALADEVPDGLGEVLRDLAGLEH